MREQAMNTKKIFQVAPALVLLAAVVVALLALPVKDYLAGFLGRVESAGPWGPVLLVAAYAVACVLFVPGSVLTLGAGFLFGVVYGTMVVSAGSVLGATAAFLVGRTYAPRVDRKADRGLSPIPGGRPARWASKGSRSYCSCGSPRSFPSTC